MTTYNFSDPYGKGVKDNIPDWMENVLNKQKKESVDLEKVKNIYSNSESKKIRKCSVCGKVLNSNEIGKCKGCLKI